LNDVNDNGSCQICVQGKAQSEKEKKEHETNVVLALKQLPTLRRTFNTMIPERLERSASSCEAQDVSWLRPGCYVWVSRSWLMRWRRWIGDCKVQRPIWPPPVLNTWKCQHGEFVIPPRLDTWIRSNVSGSKEDVEETIDALSHDGFESGELLDQTEFEDISKHFNFISSKNENTAPPSVLTMPSFHVDYSGVVTSKSCEKCFGEKKMSYDKSMSEFKDITVKVTFLPPGQSPMGVLTASPSSSKSSGTRPRRRRTIRRTSVRVPMSSSDKIGVVKYRILNRHCFVTRSMGNSCANEWVRLMNENSAADLRNDLRVSEAGIRLDQRLYYTVITVDMMPDIADYLPRDANTVERGFAGTHLSSQSTPMEDVVEIESL